ncbi:rhodanese-like domain-containing protein [uncultured Tateyamaria sp.]|uniref:rhodanese-like domain-containing protein n=1 Tax=uncultured Tateyamaria sp. TaxID=455651 RepID=UPI0026172657|nr:rhodanese-like domain-containing protein [uncultured Tateyamaria sp.]
MLGTGLAAVVGGGTFAATWFNIFADADAKGALSVEAADAQATKGEIYLIDIRRPDEWERTGVGQSAIPIDMRRKDFEATLQALYDKQGIRPVALICARGVRSDRMNTRLKAAGFTDILDVPEGMLGSGAGPGWIARDLPLRSPTTAELNGQVPVSL